MAKFKPRERKHKINKRSQHTQTTRTIQDTNISEILKSSSTKNEERQGHEKVGNEQLGMPSQKRKRMEKYVASKLKKEENAALIRKLAAAKVDTSLYLATKNLGSFTSNLVGDVIESSEDEFAGFDSPPHLSGDQADNVTKLQSAEKKESSSASIDESRTSPNNINVTFGASSSVEAKLSTPVGIGLKQGFEVDDDGRPVIPKRRRYKGSFKAHHDNLEHSNISVGIAGGKIGSIESAGSESRNFLETDLEASVDSTGHSSDETSSSGSEETNSELDDSDSEVISDRQESLDLIARNKQRSQAFKAWINDSRRHVDEDNKQENSKANSERPIEKKAQDHPSVRLMGDSEKNLHEALQIPIHVPDRKAFTVPVDRPAVYQESRLGLPVVAEEQRIMEAIHNNPVVIICGDTGSGKTTQVPQFLYEAGYGFRNGSTPGMIGITQPRRVAAVSSANRVREELGTSSDKVSYQIRFDSTVSSNTAIKYMTDGILLREISQDITLSNYSAIIIDEAHERTVNTDILIGMLSRVIDIRNSHTNAEGEKRPLKLVIMSATLRVADFQSNKTLFRQGLPPIIQVEGRQHPVTIHFARITQRDYMEETFKKVCKAHKRLPLGGMLVFLTGQNEINTLVTRLRESLSKSTTFRGATAISAKPMDMPLDIDDIEVDDDLISNHSQSSRQENFADSDSDEDFELVTNDKGSILDDVHVVPLYSQLPTNAQLKVFEPPPKNKRLIVLATNVAETSLTIPDIRYVFDCGRAKERKYDKVTGVQSFEVGWISKASANQRAGRAGRMGPGHVYRLYSSAVYERDFEDYVEPEIMRTPIDGVVLQLKSMKLRNIIGFPFPNPPDIRDLGKAEKLLAYLGGLDSEGDLTTQGQALAKYPVSPRFAKMLCIGHQADCIYMTAATVAALVTRDIFVTDAQSHDPTDVSASVSKRPLGHIHSGLDKSADFLKYLCAFATFSWEAKDRKELYFEEFCNSVGLRYKAMKEAHQLWQQLLRVVSRNHPGPIDLASKLPIPTKKQIAALKQIVAAGFIDQIAIRADLSPNPPVLHKTLKRATDVPYFTLFPSYEGRATTIEEKAVFLHPSSVLAHTAANELPHYIIYSHLQRLPMSAIKGDTVPKVRMHPLTPLQASKIAHLAHGTPLLQYGKPEYRIDQHSKQKTTYVIPLLIGEKGSTGWPLPAQIVS
jgi:ATP-dependent RNA helicase DHX37/DHR1